LRDEKDFYSHRYNKMQTEKPKTTLRSILIALGIAIFFLATGLFGGYGYAKKSEAILIDTFSYKIDSINKLNQVYLDSITRLSVKDEEVIRYITRWKIRYDTIRPKEDLNELLKGLDEVGKTNPK
jgi:hypothetical protein